MCCFLAIGWTNRLNWHLPAEFLIWWTVCPLWAKKWLCLRPFWCLRGVVNLFRRWLVFLSVFSRTGSGFVWIWITGGSPSDYRSIYPEVQPALADPPARIMLPAGTSGETRKKEKICSMTPSSERSIKGLLNAFSWAGSGSVKGAWGMVMCGGEGIHMPLTGPGQHLPLRLWPLMGHHRKLLITFLNNAYFIRVKTVKITMKILNDNWRNHISWTFLQIL